MTFRFAFTKILFLGGFSDLKSALGKKRRDGKRAPIQPLTTMQRAHIQPLIEKYGDNYEV